MGVLGFPSAGGCRGRAVLLRSLGTVPAHEVSPPPGVGTQPESPDAPSHPDLQPCPIPTAPAWDRVGVCAAAGHRAGPAPPGLSRCPRGGAVAEGQPADGDGGRGVSRRCPPWVWAPGPGQRRWGTAGIPAMLPRKGGNAARCLLAPAAMPRACQPRLRRRASLPVAPGGRHTHATMLGRARTAFGDATAPHPTQPQTDRRTEKLQLLIEKETYSLLWLAGPCPARVTFSSTAVRLAGRREHASAGQGSRRPRAPQVGRGHGRRGTPGPWQPQPRRGRGAAVAGSPRARAHTEGPRGEG